jgi:hypothetical protein
MLAKRAAGTPESPENYSHDVLNFPESGLFTGCASLSTEHCPVHTGQSGAPRLVQVWLALAKLLHLNFSRFEKFPST